VRGGGGYLNHVAWGDVSAGFALGLALLGALVGALVAGFGVQIALRRRRIAQAEALARAVEARRSLERQRALLFELTRLHSETNALGKFLYEVTERLGAGLGLERLAVFLVEDEALVLRSFYGAGGALAPPNARHPLRGDPFGALAMSTGSRFCDEGAASGLPLPSYVDAGGAVAIVPIVRGRDAHLGLLVASEARGARPSIDTAPFLLGLAEQIGLSAQQEQLIAKLRELSTHDPLTGLANRRLLSSRLEAEARSSERFGHDTALIAIDVDYFKQLNDKRGHQAGDEALVTISELICASVRKVDLVARVGGEEFVVVLPRTGLAAANHVAEKLRVRVASARFPGGEALPDGRLTVSVGVSVLGHDLDTEALLADADQAMYAAKARGRNRVEVHEPGHRAPLRSGGAPSTSGSSPRAHRPHGAG
jgi:diguanylate cyclase (GGDEF)-like protein